MKLKSGLPYSLIKNGLVNNYPKLGKNIRADVIVLGAGISGALTSWHLVSKNIDCVVIDARTIGLGSTCASSSLLLYEIDTPLYKLSEISGPSKASRAYKVSQEAIVKLQDLARRIKFNDIQSKESIWYAAQKKDIGLLKKEFELRRKQGIAVSFFEGTDAAKQTGLNIGAALISSLAAQTDAYMFTHALLRNAVSKGLRVFDRTPAVEIKTTRGGIEIITDDGMRIKAKKIIYATGYETMEMISRSLVNLQSTYVTVSESFDAECGFWNGERLIWNTADPYLYARTTPDKRIMVGGRDEKFYSPAKRDRLIDKKTRQLKKDLEKIFPTEFKPEFSWTGSFASTKDGLPFIGICKDVPNSYFALGFGGNGITFSMIAAEIITDLVRGKKNPDSALFSFDR